MYVFYRRYSFGAQRLLAVEGPCWEALQLTRHPGNRRRRLLDSQCRRGDQAFQERKGRGSGDRARERALPQCLASKRDRYYIDRVRR